MKKIVIFLSVAALSVVAASCSNLNTEPSFDDRNAFVEFDKGSKVVKEDDGEISIPVTLCSLKGIEDAVSFEVKDGKAKAGTDFELLDGTAVLNFDSSNRTRNIKIKVIEHKGEYTGDLDFTIVLKSAGTSGIGMVKKCKVTIQDNDHPLANILGEYTATGKYYDGSPLQWTVTFSKDADDPTILHIDALSPFCLDYASWGDWSIIGSVNDEKTEITVADNQATKVWYKTDGDFLTFCTLTDDLNYYLEEDLVFTKQADGTWTTPASYVYESNEFNYVNTIVNGPVTLTKK